MGAIEASLVRLVCAICVHVAALILQPFSCCRVFFQKGHLAIQVLRISSRSVGEPHLLQLRRQEAERFFRAFFFFASFFLSAFLCFSFWTPDFKKDKKGETKRNETKRNETKGNEPFSSSLSQHHFHTRINHERVIFYWNTYKWYSSSDSVCLQEGPVEFTFRSGAQFQAQEFHGL